MSDNVRDAWPWVDGLERPSPAPAPLAGFTLGSDETIDFTVEPESTSWHLLYSESSHDQNEFSSRIVYLREGAEPVEVGSAAFGIGTSKKILGAPKLGLLR